MHARWTVRDAGAMKLTTASTLLAGLASCAKPAPATGPSNTGGGTATIADGIHGCQFIVGGDAYGPHRCDVTGGAIAKRSGMEHFSGTLSAGDEGPRLEATMACGDLSSACDRTFTVELRRDGGVWRGPIVAAPGPESWLLDGSSFEIDDAAGYGGAGYGGDGYGGE